MATVLREAPIIMWRESRLLMRNPVPIVLGFVNPILWLLLFGSVFYNLARFPASLPRTTRPSSSPAFWR